MTEGGERRILDAIGGLGEKLDRTREEAAGQAASLRGQERSLERIDHKLDREQEERRKAIGKVTERVVRVEGTCGRLERQAEADTTGRQSALTPADAAALAPPPAPTIHSLRAAASGSVEIARWKAIAGIGVPLAAAIAGWIAHLFR